MFSELWNVRLNNSNQDRFREIRNKVFPQKIKKWDDVRKWVPNIFFLLTVYVSVFTCNEKHQQCLCMSLDAEDLSDLFPVSTPAAGKWTTAEMLHWHFPFVLCCLSGPCTPWRLSQLHLKALFQAQLLHFHSVNWLFGVSGSISRLFERWVSHINHQLISWLAGWLSKLTSQTPPPAVSARCPSTRLSACPSRSAVRAGGRGGVGCRRTGSAARSE